MAASAPRPWSAAQVSLFWGILAVVAVLTVGSILWVDSVLVAVFISGLEVLILVLAVVEFKRVGVR